MARLTRRAFLIAGAAATGGLLIGIGTGPARRFRPGDPALGVYDVLTGPPITHMSAAELIAQPGEIVQVLDLIS